MDKWKIKFVKKVKSRIPILTWLPKYSLDWLVSDMIAGITVGLTVIPQVKSPEPTIFQVSFFADIQNEKCDDAGYCICHSGWPATSVWALLSLPWLLCLLPSWQVKYLFLKSSDYQNLFSSTKDVTIGPTAIMAIMTGEVFAGDKEVSFYIFNSICLILTPYL